MQVEIVKKEEQERYGNFNRIRMGGLSADVRAYALSIEEMDVADPLTRQPLREKRAWLWYLDMVGRSREAVKAIWAGLVNSPPKPAILSRLDFAVTTDEIQASETPSSVWAYLADNQRCGGFRLKYAALPKASAQQAVLVPQIALYRSDRTPGGAVPEPEDSSDTKENDQTTPAPPLQPQPEFLLLYLPELENEVESSSTKLEELLRLSYYRQVDALSCVPLFSAWADWLWEYATSEDLIRPLISVGCGAWLCRLPRDKNLAAALKSVLERKEIETLWNEAVSE